MQWVFWPIGRPFVWPCGYLTVTECCGILICGKGNLLEGDMMTILELRCEMVGWLMDLEFEEDELNFVAMSTAALIRAIDRHFCGGFAEFYQNSVGQL